MPTGSRAGSMPVANPKIVTLRNENQLKQKEGQQVFRVLGAILGCVSRPKRQLHHRIHEWDVMSSPRQAEAKTYAARKTDVRLFGIPIPMEQSFENSLQLVTRKRVENQQHMLAAKTKGAQR